jgi:hypothetical protein
VSVQARFAPGQPGRPGTGIEVTRFDVLDNVGAFNNAWLLGARHVETVLTTWIIPAGAIVAALIAGLFSFFSLVLSKEQKLSELRQSWIEGLRDDLAEFAAGIQAIELLDRAYNEDHAHTTKLSELYEVLLEPLTTTRVAYTRIVLRLNPADRSSATQSLISELGKIADLSNRAEYEEAGNCIPEMRKQAQLVLKAEWERVKQGEPTFQWSKRIALIVLVATIILGGSLEIHTGSQRNTRTAQIGTSAPVNLTSGADNNGSEPR